MKKQQEANLPQHIAEMMENIESSTKYDEVWEMADEVIGEFDSHFKLEYYSTACWCGELRVTYANPQSKPARSITFWVTGCTNPSHVLVRLVKDFVEWQQHPDTDITPNPIPDWMQ